MNEINLNAIRKCIALHKGERVKVTSYILRNGNYHIELNNKYYYKLNWNLNIVTKMIRVQ